MAITNQDFISRGVLDRINRINRSSLCLVRGNTRGLALPPSCLRSLFHHLPAFPSALRQSPATAFQKDSRKGLAGRLHALNRPGSGKAEQLAAGTPANAAELAGWLPGLLRRARTAARFEGPALRVASGRRPPGIFPESFHSPRSPPSTSRNP